MRVYAHVGYVWCAVSAYVIWVAEVRFKYDEVVIIVLILFSFIYFYLLPSKMCSYSPCEIDTFIGCQLI